MPVSYPIEMIVADRNAFITHVGFAQDEELKSLNVDLVSNPLTGASLAVINGIGLTRGVFSTSRLVLAMLQSDLLQRWPTKERTHDSARLLIYCLYN